MWSFSQASAIVLLMLMLFLISGRGHAQPLWREGDSPPAAETERESDLETPRLRALARQQAEQEEKRQLKLQQLMRMRGEQMLAEQEEIKRRDQMMRYALVIAVAVIVTTLLVAYARSRVREKDAGGPSRVEPKNGSV